MKILRKEGEYKLVMGTKGFTINSFFILDKNLNKIEAETCISNDFKNVLMSCSPTNFKTKCDNFMKHYYANIEEVKLRESILCYGY